MRGFGFSFLSCYAMFGGCAWNTFSFFLREMKEGWIWGREDGERLGGIEGGKTVVGMQYMKEKNLNCSY